VTRRHIAEEQKLQLRRCQNKNKKNTKLAWFTKANAFVNDGTATRTSTFNLVCLGSKYFLYALSYLPLHLEYLLSFS
jgi:hypothetical protein